MRTDQIRHAVGRHYKRYHKWQEPALEHWRLRRHARSSFRATAGYGKTGPPSFSLSPSKGERVAEGGRGGGSKVRSANTFRGFFPRASLAGEKPVGRHGLVWISPRGSARRAVLPHWEGGSYEARHLLFWLTIQFWLIEVPGTWQLGRPGWHTLGLLFLRRRRSAGILPAGSE